METYGGWIYLKKVTKGRMCEVQCERYPSVNKKQMENRYMEYENRGMDYKR